jgi:hypothetical protein
LDYNYVTDRIGEVIDGAGVAVIGAVTATAAAAVRLSHHQPGTYRRFGQQPGRTILLGLELLVAGDIIRTVTSSSRPDAPMICVCGPDGTSFAPGSAGRAGAASDARGMLLFTPVGGGGWVGQG